MRQILLGAAAAICILASPALAATELFPAQDKQFVGVVKVEFTTPLRTAPIVLAEDKDDKYRKGDKGDPGKDCKEGRDRDCCRDDDRSYHVVSRSKPCKDHHGFENDRWDSSPNGWKKGNRNG